MPGLAWQTHPSLRVRFISPYLIYLEVCCLVSQSVRRENKRHLQRVIHSVPVQHCSGWNKSPCWVLSFSINSQQKLDNQFWPEAQLMGATWDEFFCRWLIFLIHHTCFWPIEVGLVTKLVILVLSLYNGDSLPWESGVWIAEVNCPWMMFIFVWAL